MDTKNVLVRQAGIVGHLREVKDQHLFIFHNEKPAWGNYGGRLVIWGKIGYLG